MSFTVLIVLLAIGGLAVGSFVNVVIVRVPSDMSLSSPPSQCPLCETPIAKRDNIPVLSWLLLKGRCRSCGEPIPAGYPLVEIANTVLWVLAGVRFGESWVVLPFAILFSVLLALSVIDLELYILPNKITYPSILVSVPAIVVLSLALADDPTWAIIWAVVGAVAYSGILFVTLIGWELIMKREGMGLGDVKLAVLLGLWLGWLHPALPVYAMIAASLLGILAGLAVLVVRRRSEAYPFGPWLALGAVIVILLSGPILRANGFEADDAEGAAAHRAAEASSQVAEASSQVEAPR